MKSLSLDIDQSACWGCLTCQVACIQEASVSENISMIRISENGPHMLKGQLDFSYAITVCQHCEDPDCMTVCPVEAITKRNDGIVILDGELCTGCELCLDACPFDAIYFDKSLEIATKCNLCHQRIDAGLLPACADNVCLAHCIRLEG
jgi:Fe-S-cluster-containing dehydrogenase component